MRLGYSVGIVIGVLLVIVLLVTSFLPQEVERDGQLLICVEPDQAFELFDRLEEVAAWSSLIGSVPEEERQIEGDSGEGAAIRLEDEGGRWIHLEVTESLEPQQVSYRFTTHQGFLGNARVGLEPEPRGTVVDMRLGVEFQSFMGRWAIIFARSALDDLIRHELTGIQSVMEDRDQACEDDAAGESYE